MKKIALLLTALVMCVAAQAQVRTSRTFVKQKANMEWIIRAGLNINHLAGFDGGEGVKIGSRAGFDVDFGFNRYFNNSNLYWGMELGFNSRGGSVGVDEEKFKMAGYNVKYSPFTIGYKFPVADGIKIDPHFGVYASYDFATSMKFDDGEESYDMKDYIDFDNKYDVGIQIGAGIWYQRFNLDLMYVRGFINAFDSYGMEGGKTSNFEIRLGVAF